MKLSHILIPAALCMAIVGGAISLLSARAVDPVVSLSGSLSSAEAVLAALPRAPEASREDRAWQAMEAAAAKVKLAPLKSAAWVQLGDAIAQLQRSTGWDQLLGNAQEVYREALRLQPNQAAAFAGLAWATGGRHEFAVSISWARLAIAADAGCAEAYGVLGDAQVELGDYATAMDSYQTMMDLRPDLSSWSRGAHLLWLMGEGTRAQWLLRKALAAGAPFAENTAWCRARLAMMQYHEGALLAAVETLKPVLMVGCRNRHVLLAGSRLAAAQGLYVEAERLLKVVLSGGGQGQLEVLIGLGELAEAQGEVMEAGEHYAAAEGRYLENQKMGSHDHMVMARYYANHERQLPEALRLIEEHKDSVNITDADTVAWVYHKCGQAEKAIVAMKRALRHGTPDAELHYHAGVLAAAVGDRPAAQRHLLKVQGLQPNFHVIHGGRALEAMKALHAR